MPTVLIFAALVVYLERRQAHSLKLLQTTVEATAEAVAKAVQVATTPPPPLERPSASELAREFYEEITSAAGDEPDETDPTDEITWLRGERPGAALVNGNSPAPFGIQGLTFPSRDAQ